jgi:hypothetical protein
MINIHNFLNNFKFVIIFFKSVKIIIITIICLEFSSYTASKTKILPINSTPYFYSKSNYENTRTEKNIWGAWHPENQTVSHVNDCINAVYTYNNVGAKDGDFKESRNKKKRIILLGDSIAESYGLSNNESFDSEIEKNSDYEVYNFGFAGSAGVLQYHLIYENLAKKFQHDSIIIFFFPGNDFLDNDYNVWKESGWDKFEDNQQRYRPYYKKIAKDDFQYFIPENAIKRENWKYANKKRLKTKLKFFLDNYFWSMNLYKSFYYIKYYKPHLSNSYSGFFDSSLEQQEANIYFLKRIINSRNFEFIRIVLFPTKEDLNRINALPEKSLNNQHWYKELNNLSNNSKDDLKIINMAEHIKNEKDYRKYIFSCDDHFNYQGIKFISEIIVKSFSDNVKINSTKLY